MLTHHAGVLAIALLAVACEGGAQGTHPSDDRLNGEWELVLTALPTQFATEPRETSAKGTLAFLPNSAGALVPDFKGIPQQIGSHNLQLGALMPELGPRTGAPAAAGALSGDSVRIVLDPASAEPVILHGSWHDGEVAGEWTAHQRAGIDRGGRFTLKRRPP